MTAPSLVGTAPAPPGPVQAADPETFSPAFFNPVAFSQTQ